MDRYIASRKKKLMEDGIQQVSEHNLVLEIFEKNSEVEIYT